MSTNADNIGMFDSHKNNNDTIASSDEVLSILDDIDIHTRHLLGERTVQANIDGNWHLSQISTPANVQFNVDDSTVGHLPSQSEFYRQFDDSLGEGQTIYVIEPGWAPNAKVCIPLGL